MMCAQNRIVFSLFSFSKKSLFPIVDASPIRLFGGDGSVVCLFGDEKRAPQKRSEKQKRERERERESSTSDRVLSLSLSLLRARARRKEKRDLLNLNFSLSFEHHSFAKLTRSLSSLFRRRGVHRLSLPPRW